MTWRMRRAIRLEMEHRLRSVREWVGPSESPESLGITYTTTPTKRGCDWLVDVTMGGHPNLGCYENASRWHPGPLQYAGRVADEAEAAERAREVIDYARSVHAELIATVAPPRTETVRLS